MIASRKVERLQEAVQEIRALLPPESSARVEWVECNIRKEDQVGHKGMRAPPPPTMANGASGVVKFGKTLPLRLQCSAKEVLTSLVRLEKS